ncbi:glycosyl hydrolase family 28-related protein [Paenibacillus allorhizosphaerae]|uniref:Rhamnogalacturonase A/B/Epimerase-like pectate lyase domain-containing protein n=1 Tax=Paenibacillus allorhizosphaerae TaxID=2849866 RepID=A0ABM8VSQ5_9BACL|nr:glycosyl hydrolase family 28-related protein [Paenibacillus allorhizosphaerae]CAG7656842.1 hypothetical protein PAECIP111802_06537 [Paenibacillus allorhizosphaerae]
MDEVKPNPSGIGGEGAQKAASVTLSRRKLLAALGVAGAAGAAAAVCSSLGVAYGNYAPSVGESVYGNKSGTADLMEPLYCIATTIAGLRAEMSPNANIVYYVTDRGQEGHFYYDPNDSTAQDNLGIVLVSASGARFKRIVEPEYVSVKWFGAKGDGVNDDFQAIQNAINAVSALGGGTVFFPKGTYLVSPYLNKWITLRSNVNLLGEGRSSVIKVKDNAGDYFAIFYGSASTPPLANVRISNLRIDQNPANNTTCNIDLNRQDTNYYYQFCIISYKYDNVVIDNVQFDPTCGVNTVSLNSDTGREAKITNCYVNFVMAKGSGDYDNSAIYLNGRNHLVSGCTFYAAPGQKARGAIETHMGQSVVTGNVMDGYYTGVNLQAGNADRCDMTVDSNTISNANQGIQIGPYGIHPVKNVTVSGNTISLVNLVHKRNLTVGISSAGWTSDTTLFENIIVSNNTIVFQEEFERRTELQSAVGIGFTHDSDLSDVVISNNIIKNAPMTGILIGSAKKIGTVTDLQITGNMIVNAGHYPAVNEAYRAGILLRSSVNGARIADNVIADNYDAAKGLFSIRINDSDGTYTNVAVADNLIKVKQGGLWQFLSPSVIVDPAAKLFKYSAVFPPASGTYNSGDIVWFTGGSVTDGKTPVGYKVTVTGTAGTLNGVLATGTAGLSTITVNDASQLDVEQWIRITAGNQVRRIVRISGNEVRLNAALVTGATSSEVSYVSPAFKPFGHAGSLAPISDTNGATLVQLEAEVNVLKQALREFGVVAMT